MASANFNLEDPAKQERVRREPHEYIPTAGKHGVYVPKPYQHQEYPKMMLKEPRPQLDQFLKVNGVAIPQDSALKLWEDACKEWDRRCSASIVKSAAEEKAWLREHGS